MTSAKGVWVSYKPAGSGFDVRVWRSEISALRHGISENAEVVFVEFGDSIDDALGKDSEAKAEAMKKESARSPAAKKAASAGSE